MMKIGTPALTKAIISEMFDALDANRDGDLSYDEFAAYVSGAAKARKNLLNQLDRETQDDMREQIKELFNMMDTDRSGNLDIDEIFHAYQNMGIPRSKEECKKQIYDVSKGNKVIDMSQFTELMMPVMVD